MGIQYRGYNGACTRMYGIQCSLVSTVWDTASTGSYGGTVFPGGIHHLLVNNVCGVQNSVGYRIHSDTEAVPHRKIQVYCVGWFHCCMFLQISLGDAKDGLKELWRDL